MTRFLVALALAALPAASAAQTAGMLPVSTRLPASTRAMALGDAYQTDAGHADVVFYHPALLTSARGFGIDTQRWGTAGGSSAASGAMQWLGGGVGIGLRSLQYLALGSGAAAAPSGQDHLFASGSVPVSERIATVGYAREAVFDIDVGVTVDLVDERIGATRHGVALVDIGLARPVGPLTVALTVHDLGQKPILETGAAPSRVTLGAGGYGQPIGPLDLGLAATIGVDDDEVTFGGGVELGYWPVSGRTFVARVGLQDVPEGSDASPLTTGFAFWGDNLTLEWAFRPFSGAEEGGSHRFGVRWR